MTAPRAVEILQKLDFELLGCLLARTVAALQQQVHRKHSTRYEESDLMLLQADADGAL